MISKLSSPRYYCIGYIYLYATLFYTSSFSIFNRAIWEGRSVEVNNQHFLLPNLNLSSKRCLIMQASYMLVFNLGGLQLRPPTLLGQKRLSFFILQFKTSYLFIIFKSIMASCEFYHLNHPHSSNPSYKLESLFVFTIIDTSLLKVKVGRAGKQYSHGL